MNEVAHDDDWLRRFTPREWIRAGLADVSRAERALAQRDRRAGLAGCRRAAGMGINAILATQSAPDVRYGRTYMEHLLALADEPNAPSAVREAATVLHQTALPGGQIVLLGTPATSENWLEAAKTILAHGLAMVMKAEGPSEG